MQLLDNLFGPMGPAHFGTFCYLCVRIRTQNGSRALGDAVVGLLEAILDPVSRAIANASVDDQPETDQERQV